MIRSTSLFLALNAALCAQGPIPIAPVRMQPVAAATESADVAMQPSRAIDLVICLDVSGSMSGLINAARQNLWAIVNEMATLQPQPQLRVALLTYGCPDYGKESGFVRIETPLTGDLDLVSQKLFALNTNGGDEYVARVVKRSLDDLEWSTDPMALKLVFVAGNEAATQDPQLDAMQIAGMAIGKGVLVNTIYCGDQQNPEADAWRQVARRADGNFTAIEQDQQVVIESPFDKRLQDLSTRLNGTYVLYGKGRAAWGANQVAQDLNAATLNTAAVAQRCQTKGSALYFNPQHDLVDACKQPGFDLASVKKEDLPEELRKLTPVELQAHVDAKTKERKELQKQIEKLGKQRDAYVAAERKKRSADGARLFEQAMLEAVRAQAKARGFTCRTEDATSDQQASGASRFEQVIENAVKDYQRFTCVTGTPRVAPTLCRMPPGPFARTSQAGDEHGGKLYLLYVRNAEGNRYIEPGKPAAVGQTLVKESWQRVKGRQQGASEASRRYPGGLVLVDEGEDYHAGDAIGLFVMHKLAADTPGTDQGWVYGTVDPSGRVTAAGRIASCVKCHEEADNDRRFGLK